MKHGEKHPLTVDRVYSIGTWKEWLKLWEENPIAEIRHSLLHFGFNVPNCDNFVERVCFYISIADCGSFWSFTLPDESRESFQSTFGRTSIDSIRREVAKKAYEVLWHEVLNKQDPQRGKYLPPSWLRFVGNPKIFHALLNLFRVDEEGKFVNPSRFNPRVADHIKKGTEEFLYDFCSFGWGGAVRTEWEEYAGEAASKLFADHRPQLSKMLFALGKVDGVFGNKRVPMDPDCRKVLMELTLNQTGYFPGSREPRSPKDLREAVFLGSAVARLILAKDIESEERERLEKIARLRENQESDARLIENLSR